MPTSPAVEAGDLAELGLDDLPPGAVVLLEWPDRAPSFCRQPARHRATLAPKLKLGSAAPA
jgi:hypothetical protein